MKHAFVASIWWNLAHRLSDIGLVVLISIGVLTVDVVE